MGLEQWLMALAPWASMGICTGGSFVAFKWIVEWASGRYDKRADRIDQRADKVDAGMEKLVKLLQQQVAGLTERLTKAEQIIEQTREELAACERKHADSEGRVKQLEGMMQGFGDARQQAALIVADEKRNHQ